MNKEVQPKFSPQFENSWLPWIALRHFLPASSVRSLCATMVHQMSAGAHSLENMIEEHLSGGDVFLESWIIRPKTCATKLENYLLRFVKQIVWKNDQPIIRGDDSLMDEAAISPGVLEFAFNLGSSDLANSSVPLSDINYVQPELKALFDAISLCSSSPDIVTAEVTGLIKDINLVLKDVHPCLKLATLKHLGDLYADRDRWVAAAEFYTQAKNELSGLVPSANHGDFVFTMKAVIEQSLATCAAITNGYGRAQSILSDTLNAEGKGNGTTLIIGNLTLDEYVARARSQDSTFPEDTRSAILTAPLLADSHTAEHALASLRNKDFHNAESGFWSVLRRQISLGQFAASKSIKGLFASCIIEDLCSRKPYSIDSFRLAIRLLIESENLDQATHIRWPDDLLDSVIDNDICQQIIDHTEAYIGVRKRRRAIAICLFSEWTRNVSIGNVANATMMLRYLIRVGSELNANLLQDGADFKTCISAVLDICKRRPEFRYEIREELAEVLARRIGSAGYWTGEEAALRLAAECAPTFEKEGLKQVVRAVVSLLEKTAPSGGNWIVVRPAIHFLGVESVAVLAGEEQELARDIIRSILKFSSSESEGTYSADIIFSINQYKPTLVDSKEVIDQFKPLVTQALQKASQINASNAVNYMMALLVAPRAVGKDAVGGVLQILSRTIESAITGKAVLSFGAAFAPLRYLVAYRAEICQESTMPVEEMENSLTALCEKMQLTWQTAIQHPTIFSPLAILRQPEADRVIVHNWVIASLELAESVNRLDAMRAEIERARVQRQLSDGISLGFSTRHAGGADSAVDSAFMDNESRGAFYSAIGRRLSALKVGPDRIFITKLVRNTLRHGPRQVDVAVFASISPQDIDDLPSLKQNLEDYEARIGDDRELALVLNPLVQRWRQTFEN